MNDADFLNSLSELRRLFEAGLGDPNGEKEKGHREELMAELAAADRDGTYEVCGTVEGATKDPAFEDMRIQMEAWVTDPTRQPGEAIRLSSQASGILVSPDGRGVMFTRDLTTEVVFLGAFSIKDEEE